MKTTTTTFASPAAFGVPAAGTAALAGSHAGIGNTQAMWQAAVRVRGTDAAHKPGDPPRKTSGV